MCPERLLLESYVKSDEDEAVHIVLFGRRERRGGEFVCKGLVHGVFSSKGAEYGPSTFHP